MNSPISMVDEHIKSFPRLRNNYAMVHLTFILCKISHTYTLRVGCAKNRTLSIRPNAADVYQTIIFLVSTQDSNLVCCFRELAN